MARMATKRRQADHGQRTHPQEARRFLYMARRPRQKSRRKRWEDELEPDVRTALDEIRAEFLAGRLKKGISELHRLARECLGIDCCYGAFRNYLNRES